MNTHDTGSTSPGPAIPGPLLLLSGSGLQPWIWDQFIDELPAGTPVGVATRPPSGSGSLADYVGQALEAAPAEPCTIVAHSLGAIVGLAVATAAPTRVHGFLAVSGVVPRAPGSFMTAMPLPNRWVLGAAMRIAGTRPPNKALRRSLTPGLQSPIADRVVNEFEPESAELFRSRIDWAELSGRRGYVSTANDAEFAPKLQQRFSDALRPEWTTSLETGHLPMLENPSRLATAIVEFAQTPTT